MNLTMSEWTLGAGREVVYFDQMEKPPKPAPTAQKQQYLPDWFKQAIAVGLIVFGGAAWVLVYYVPAKIDSQTKSLSEDVSSLRTEVAGVKQSIDRIDRTIGDLLKPAMERLFGGKPGGQASLRQDLELGIQLAKTARGIGYKANPQTVAQTGMSYINIATRDPQLAGLAWQAATELMNYRSFLNADLNVRSSAPTTTLAGPGVVVSPGAGLENLVFEGGTQTLDGGILKNVVFRNARIRFTGGAVHLQNVYFQGCTFEVTPSPEGTKLARVLLASAAVTADISS